jgi:hypothetical protein
MPMLAEFELELTMVGKRGLMCCADCVNQSHLDRFAANLLGTILRLRKVYKDATKEIG